MPKKNSAFDIRKDAYEMATVNGTSAEITMYGEVVESRPIDWWSGQEIDGDFIIMDEFMEDLEKIANCSAVTIRLNSIGGNAAVGTVIHNRLRELSRNGMALSCIVDGVAMSAGSVIMCACDTVKVNPTSLVMIHNSAYSLFGSYNAQELRQSATALDAYDKAMVAAYVRKTGLAEDELKAMMDETTFMTGKEALDKGFADELLDDAEPLDIAASADGKSIYCKGRKMHLAPGMFAPDSIPTVKPGEGDPEPQGADSGKTIDNTVPAPTGQEGGNHSMASNLEELRAEYPELTKQLEAEAEARGSGKAEADIKAERQRLQEIDAIASLFSEEMVTEAKYGETACTAQELSYRAAQAAQKNGTAFMQALQDDAKASGAAQVTGAHREGDAVQEPKTEAQMMAEAKATVSALFHPETVKKEDE